jgi:hypothetical protein
MASGQNGAEGFGFALTSEQTAQHEILPAASVPSYQTLVKIDPNVRSRFNPEPGPRCPPELVVRGKHGHRMNSFQVLPVKTTWQLALHHELLFSSQNQAASGLGRQVSMQLQSLQLRLRLHASTHQGSLLTRN